MKIEQIHVGMSESHSSTIIDPDIKAFADISGDRNPVHLDESYAEGSCYKKRIAHSLFSASYFSAIFGTKLPGAGCVYVSQNLSFRRPVYIDDTVTATVTVTKVDIEQRRIFFDTICTVNKKKVITGVAEIYLPEVHSD